MPGDEVQPMVGTGRALLRRIRLSRAETADPSIFVAPGRLQAARRLLVSGLSAGMPPDTLPCGDN